MRFLTRRQQEIFDFIKEFIDKNGFSPTVREIAQGTNLASSSTVAGHLNNIKKKGYIDWKASCPRTIRVLMNEVG